MPPAYRIHSNIGDGLWIGDLLQKEGKAVDIVVKDKDIQLIYDGFKGITKSPSIVSWAGKIRKGDIVIFDSVGDGTLGDSLRYRGFDVIGGQRFGDKLELDRGFGMQEMANAGINIPKSYIIPTLQECMKFARANKGRWVFKPYGPTQGLSADTYVSRDTDDLLEFLKHYKPQPHQKFLMQKFEEGLEVSTELFFSKGLPMGSPTHTCELKKFLAGDLGPNTGCMSTVEALGSMESKIVKEGIAKIFPLLFKEKYTGNLDLNTIISKSGELFALEFTPRFGYSSFNAQAMMLDEPFGEFLARMARGTAMPTKYKKGYGLSIRLCIPPYPLEVDDVNKKYALPLLRETAHEEVGYDEELEKEGICYMFSDVYEKSDKLWTSGNDGIICEVACRGETIEEVEAKIFKAVKAVNVGDMQYRQDAFERAKEYFQNKTVKEWIT